MTLFSRSNPVVDESDPRLVTGTPEDRRQARAEFKHAKRLRDAMRSGLPELERGALVFEHFGHVVHDGAIYKIRRGELEDAKHCGAVAFYLDEASEPIFLELPNGPRTVTEREQQ